MKTPLHNDPLTARLSAGAAANRPRWISNGLTTVLFALTAIGAMAVLLSSLPYLLPRSNHPFLLERPLLSSQSLWRAVLRLHVVSGMLCLPLGLYLLHPRAVAHRPVLHARLGRLYVTALLFPLFPTGIYLAVFAKGGWAVSVGFILSNVATAIFSVAGVLAALRHDLESHRQAMLRAYAQLASAISFRLYHVAFQLLALPYEATYLSSLWLSVLVNAAIAELLIYRRRRRLALRERNRHESRLSLDYPLLSTPR